MDKIEKFLKRLTKKEREKLITVLEKIVAGDFHNLHVKKLKGYGNLYRVRKESIRIVYMEQAKEYRVIMISRRDEQTYSEF